MGRVLIDHPRPRTSGTASGMPSILEVIDHPQIWAPWFRNHTSWKPWRTFLSVLFGLPLSQSDRDLYQQCTGRSSEKERNIPFGNIPSTADHGFNEAWLIVGRRGGKSFILAIVACYLAIFRDWRPYLSPGEVGTVKIIATDRRQARVIHRYCRALLTQVPAIRSLVVHDGDDAIELNNHVTIEIQTASFRSVRGYTLIAALCDEIAYWRTDEGSANPDAEILNALRPAMATIPGAMLLAASSPYARRGELWNAYRRYHGKEAPALVWHAPTKVMNPTVRQSIIDDAYEEDPAKAAAEYGAEFRSDIETFINRDVVDAAIVPGRHELGFVSGANYVAFTDPSGGSSDAMTLAIAHRDRS